MYLQSSNFFVSYDLDMKTREKNRNNTPTEIGRFDWFIERMQTRVAFGWLSKRSGEKTSPAAGLAQSVERLTAERVRFPGPDQYSRS